jgi:hypothetical protein
VLKVQISSVHSYFTKESAPDNNERIRRTRQRKAAIDSVWLDKNLSPKAPNENERIRKTPNENKHIRSRRLMKFCAFGEDGEGNKLVAI